MVKTPDTLPESAKEALAERISTALLSDVDLRRGASKYAALPEVIQRRAEPLAQLAYAHFLPHFENGMEGLRQSIAMAESPNSELIQQFANHITANLRDYPLHFTAVDKNSERTSSAMTISRTIVTRLCGHLKNTMSVSETKAAPVFGNTAAIQALTAKILAQGQGISAQ